VGLLAWGSKQHVQRIADDLRHRAVMGEHNICHAREIPVSPRLWETLEPSVHLPTKFELVINLGTAKALGLTVIRDVAGFGTLQDLVDQASALAKDLSSDARWRGGIR
jgi:hypothetical protein